MSRNIRNATITSASIQIERGFALTLWLSLDYGDYSQGFGGYVLYHTSKGYMNEENYTGLWITKCMEVAGVDDWSKMVNKNIRVDSDNSKVYGIGHIIKNKWFYPSENTK